MQGPCQLRLRACRTCMLVKDCVAVRGVVHSNTRCSPPPALGGHACSNDKCVKGSLRLSIRQAQPVCSEAMGARLVVSTQRAGTHHSPTRKHQGAGSVCRSYLLDDAVKWWSLKGGEESW